MLDAVFAQLKGVTKNWRADAERRHRITAIDPVADTTAYLAGELDDLVKRLEADTAMLSPSEFARLHHTTAQTVTAWCRSGKITGALPKGRTWQVPRDAMPPRRRTIRRGARA